MRSIRLATRKSPLALAQAKLVAACLEAGLGASVTLRPMVSTGDRQTEWALEKQGGKGLFTAELEEALLRGDADVAVHSAKDLPGKMPPGLKIAGYLPRADARDVLVSRTDCARPQLVATSSPRRRIQLAALYPAVKFTEIRGNVDTRLNKIAGGAAEATVLAAAGLARLGISTWPGLKFLPLEITQMVPAIGQAAIAIQCRTEQGSNYAGCFDVATKRAVDLERALQAALGADCHTATAAHVTGQTLHFFDERVGTRVVALAPADFLDPAATAARLLGEFDVRQARALRARVPIAGEGRAAGSERSAVSVVS